MGRPVKTGRDAKELGGIGLRRSVGVVLAGGGTLGGVYQTGRASEAIKQRVGT